MLLGVLLAGLGRMMGRVRHVAMCYLRVMPSRLVMSRLMSPGRLLVVMRSRFVVSRCQRVVLRSLRFRRHDTLRVPC